MPPVRVNAISPGLFPSNMNPIDPAHPESNMRFAKEMPARRPGTEQEIAAVALYLAGPSGGFITGQNIRVDGGRLLVAAGRISVD
jgi:NAD(P)-dependent dehydrogenase (short-subunit alcohol dehydrogenase family)